MTRSDRTAAVSLRRLSAYNTGSSHEVSLYTNQIRKQLGDDRNSCVSSEPMDCEKHICIVTVVVILLRWRGGCYDYYIYQLWLKNIGLFRQYRMYEY